MLRFFTYFWGWVAWFFQHLTNDILHGLTALWDYGWKWHERWTNQHARHQNLKK